MLVAVKINAIRWPNTMNMTLRNGGLRNKPNILTCWTGCVWERWERVVRTIITVPGVNHAKIVAAMDDARETEQERVMESVLVRPAIQGSLAIAVMWAITRRLGTRKSYCALHVIRPVTRTVVAMDRVLKVSPKRSLQAAVNHSLNH
jgi:hypothetical protein